MTTVKQALESAIECFEQSARGFVPYEKALEQCKSALSELDKCEPVARFISKRLTPEGTQEFFGFLLVDNIPPLSLLYTAPPQPQTVRDALEKAAKICDDKAKDFRAFAEPFAAGVAEELEAEIRNLIEKE